MMAAKVTIELSIRDFKVLARYLEDHEDDMAYGINDFDELSALFVAVFDEKPKKDK